MQGIDQSDNVPTLGNVVRSFLRLDFDFVAPTSREIMEPSSTSIQTLRERFEDVRAKVSTAAERANRASEAITLIAISKTHPATVLSEGLRAGITDFGENR